VTFSVILVARRGLHADYKYSRHVHIEILGVESLMAQVRCVG